MESGFNVFVVRNAAELSLLIRLDWLLWAKLCCNMNGVVSLPVVSVFCG